MALITVTATSNLAAMLAAKEAEDKKRYKHIDIARDTGINPTIIGKWMNGVEVTDSSLSTALRLAAWLKCDLNDLLNTKVTIEEEKPEAAR